MSNIKIKKLLDERSKLLDELGTLSQLLHGSWIERYTTCSRLECKCHDGRRHGPRYYLVVNQNGRQRPKYVSNSQVKNAQIGLAQYRRLQEIVDRITHLNLALMKEEKYD